jgi:branched-chain amino acid transport system ATP-binding protein
MRVPVAGRILVEGEDLTGCPEHRLVSAGVVHCPEGRRMFPYMSAEANVRIGGFTRTDRQQLERDVDDFVDRWDAISERRKTAAGQLSGGQQQLVALGRALMARPRLLLLDEPSLGLAPVAVQQMYGALRELAAQRQSILLVEQNARHALALADHVLVLVGGEIVHSGPTAEVSAEDVAGMYFKSPGEGAAA